MLTILLCITLFYVTGSILDVIDHIREKHLADLVSKHLTQ